MKEKEDKYIEEKAVNKIDWLFCLYESVESSVNEVEGHTGYDNHNEKK